MKITLRSRLAVPLESGARLGQVGVHDVSYYMGFSPFLNWAKTGDTITVHRSAGGSLQGQAAFSAGLLDGDGDLVTPLAATTTGWQIIFHGSSGNPGQDMGGEQFRVEWSGTGTVTIGGLGGAGSVPFAIDGTRTGTFTMGANQNHAWITASGLSGSDPVQPSSVRIYQTRYAANVAAGERFNPDWLAELRAFKTLRLMAWQKVNDLGVEDAADLATVDYYLWGQPPGELGPKGSIPLQVCVELAAATGCDIWYCIPHLATDAFVTHVATYFRDNMPAGRIVKYEHSNEVWNGGFVHQHNYAREQGAILFPEQSDNFKQAMMYHGYRTAAIMKLVRDIYGVPNRARWKGVLGAFTVMPEQTTGNSILGVNEWRTDTGNTALSVADLIDEATVTSYFAGMVDTAGPIAAISQAAQAVVTSNGHGRTVGTRVIISTMGGGMGQIDGLTGTIQAVTTNTFTLNINSSGFAPYTGGGYWCLARLFDLMDQSAASYPGDVYRGVAENFAAKILTGSSPSGLVPTFGDGELSSFVTPGTGFWPRHKAICDANGIDLTLYEGGIHLLGDYGTLQANPGVNTVGNRFTAMLRGIAHRPETAVIYARLASEFMALGGIEPSKYTEAGLVGLNGAWAGVRHWPCANDANGDRDNPVWLAIKASSKASWEI